MRSADATFRDYPKLTVKGVTLGEGRPKIIVPISAGHSAAIAATCEKIRDSDADIDDWRVDRFSGRDKPAEILAQLATIAESIGGRPLLFTVRTRFEGGDSDMKKEAYRDLIADACASGHVDLVDVQYLNPMAKRAIEAAKAKGVLVVASNHDFDGTTPGEIVDRLDAMEAMGADVCKIAIMAKRPQDVADLMAATARRAESTRTPLIGVAMGPLGAITRLAGHVFGSCATFAAIDEASAPGQLNIDDVVVGLELIEKGLATPSA